MSVPCRHWRDIGIAGVGKCELRVFITPTEETCLSRCIAYDGPSRGAGDLLAKAIKTVTVGKAKPCGGCNKRKMKLNAAVPFNGQPDPG